MIVVAKTDIGRKRELNQDAAFAVKQQRRIVLAVCDGMGGHSDGAAASKAAIDVIRGAVPRLLRAPENDTVLRRVIGEANAAVCALSNGEVRRSPGTTITVAVLAKRRCFFAHVGDSRIYALHTAIGGTHRIERLTNDHNIPGDLFKGGHLTRDEADRHPYRNNLTRGLGACFGKSTEPICGVIPLDSVFAILCCSDGLHGMLADEDIARTLMSESTDPAGDLIIAANARGGDDNIGVALACMGEG